ncbi:MAG: DUF4926 domain-containing protein [Nostoc sp.]|uniref:DUF4926 domain-containing protein n=1 Tax=Nostoc sp. TaxID=1180 RepID=UPI002FEEC616
MKLLDVVALTEDLPELGLHRGQVGTIVEAYEPGVFEVEFSDLTGKAYASSKRISVSPIGAAFWLILKNEASALDELPSTH